MDKEDKNASQQIDEDEQLDTSSEQEELETETEAEESTGETEDSEQSEEDAEQSAESETEEPSKRPSRRENLRIQKLVAKLKEKNQSEATSEKQDGIDYRKAIDAPDEVYDQLESDRQSYGKSQFDKGLQQAKSIQFHTRLELDAPKVASKYPQFDPDSSDFNPTVANAINEWYLTTVGYDVKTETVSNANVRYAEFVESVMEIVDEVAGKKIETSKRNLTKQVASTGLRPDGSSAKRLNLNQAPEQMTDEELDAIIGRAIPKKR